jgi:gliding motility-associated-like protein
MKKVLPVVFLLSLCPCFLMAQTVLYNGGTDIFADAGAIIYVNGEIVNDVNGNIHNKGDIYLTHDWTNKAAAGCLDPTTGTVWLYGNTQIIKGTQSTTFNNLNCENGGTKTLNIDTYVGGTTGVLKLKTSPFVLSTNTLFMTNPSSGGITRTSGYIVSETDPTAGYGTVQWNLGVSTGSYVYPFGTTTGGYIPFIYNITSAGVQSGVGNIAVATYPTNVSASPNNRPLPSTVTNLTDLSNSTEAGPVCADRFWPVTASNYNTQPTADVTFTYEDGEWDNSGGSTNNIVEDSLRAWKWSGGQWQFPTLGSCNTSSNTVYVPNLNSVSFPWTLLGDEPIPPPPPPPCGDFYLPNAFSPNGNGKNDYFKPRSICIKTLDFRIYNRWGNLVYASDNPSAIGWDGTTPKGMESSGEVYAYEVKATLNDGTLIDKKGTVTLLK